MWIGLVTHVPDQFITGRVEDAVERDGKLDDAEPCAEMAAGDRDDVDELAPQLVGELRQLALLQATEVARHVDRVEQRSLGHGTHCHLITNLADASETSSLTIEEKKRQITQRVGFFSVAIQELDGAIG